MKRLFLTLLLASPLALVQLAAGCSQQGEGQLCSMLNNISDDCATGLTCTAVSGASVCCSVNSTNPACIGAVVSTTSSTTGVSSTAASSSSGGMGGMTGSGGATGTGGTMADAGDGG